MSAGALRHHERKGLLEPRRAVERMGLIRNLNAMRDELKELINVS
jgi:hypothetical protein